MRPTVDELIQMSGPEMIRIALADTDDGFFWFVLGMVAERYTGDPEFDSVIEAARQLDRPQAEVNVKVWQRKFKDIP